MSRNILSECFIKKEKFKPETLGGKKEITLRQLTIAEHDKYLELINDENKTSRDAMYYAVSCCMVEPKFFTDEEFEDLSIVALNLIEEIYNEMPFIGKTKAEREKYLKDMKDFFKNNLEEEKKEEVEEKKGK